MPEEFDAWLEVMTASRWSEGMDPLHFARCIALECIERWWPDEDCAGSARPPDLPS
jgi:hypothetical protein